MSDVKLLAVHGDLETWEIHNQWERGLLNDNHCVTSTGLAKQLIWEGFDIKGVCLSMV